MADMKKIKGRIAETIYPNGTGAITAEKHQSLLLDMVDNINEVKQDVLVSGQNIRPLMSGDSLLGSHALIALGTKFFYELENQQLSVIIDGARQDLEIWMANRAVYSQVAQVIEIQKEGHFQELVPLTIKNKAGVAVLCWEYDGMIYEASMEDDVLAVVSKPKGGDFDKEGNYPLLHVGTADDLAGRGESVPASFGFRASGGKSIKDGRAYIKRIKGNSVVWNQMQTPLAEAENISTNRFSGSYSNGVLTLTTKVEYAASSLTIPVRSYVKSIPNHVYLAIAKIEGQTPYASIGSKYPSLSNGYVITKADIADYLYIFPFGALSTIIPAGTTCKVSEWGWYDLTQMFGSGNEPTTIEEFYARKPIVEDEYAYNEGQVIHCNTESIKSVGDNAWGGTLEKGRLTNGIDEVNNNMVRSDDYIKILPSQEYYALAANNIGKVNFYPSFYDADKNYISGLNATKNFSTPTNAMYMRFFLYDEGGVMPTDYNGLMISLVHSGWKQDTDAGYQPYWQDTLPLPIISKYFPQGMKKAGSAHDEIRYNKASGKWEYSKGKIKSVDLGEMNWNVYSGNVFVSILNDKQYEQGGQPNMICHRYAYKVTGISELKDGEMRGLSSAKNIYFCNSAYTDAASFKAAMAGVILYYESNDWEWEELDAEDQNFRDYYNVADFGTEEAIPATDAEGNIIPSANFSADIIYQFNAVDMIREHELEITELQNVIATMQAQLTALTNGGQ